MELQTLLGDPTTGEAIIVLNDGLSRVMKFDHRAVRILEDVTKLPYGRAIGLQMTALGITAFVYAGCFADARRRKLPWTLEIVDGLLELSVYSEVWIKAQWALGVAMVPLVEATKQFVGEIVASVPVKRVLKVRKRARGRGTRP